MSASSTNLTVRKLRLDARRQANLSAMEGAVARWLDEAPRHPQGEALLRAKADWVQRQLQSLGRSAELDIDPPAHLQGLTAWDLSVAFGRLLGGADRLAAANQ